MAKIALSERANQLESTAPGVVQKDVNLTQATWHAQHAGGSAVNWTSGFTDPLATEGDRIPEVKLAVGGTPGTYVIVGTWNSLPQTESITTVANSTVKGDLPFDTVTSFTGPDPVNALDFYKGDSYADPPARMVAVEVAGDIACQLQQESAVATKSGVIAGDWNRRCRRIQHAGDGNTTATGLAFVW